MSTSQPSRVRAGFTLIELLVTISLLSVVLLLATQVVQSARSSIRTSETRSNADATARRVYSQLEQDLSSILIRPDARIEFETRSGDDRIAFLTARRGYSSSGVGDRGVSQVAYLTDGKDLLRGSRGYQFNDTGSNTLNLEPTTVFPAIPTDSQQSLSGQVLRFEVEYQMKGADTVTIETTAPKTSENLRGLVISLITVDSVSAKVLDDAKRGTLAAEFPDASAGAGTLERWNEKRDQLARSGIPGIPREILQTLRCYQRTFLVP